MGAQEFEKKKRVLKPSEKKDLSSIHSPSSAKKSNGGVYINPYEEAEALQDLTDHSFATFVTKYFLAEAVKHLNNRKETLFDINVKGMVRVLLHDRSDDVMIAFQDGIEGQSDYFYQKIIESIARQFPDEMLAAASEPSTFIKKRGDDDGMLYYTLPLRLTLNHYKIQKYALYDPTAKKKKNK